MIFLKLDIVVRAQTLHFSNLSNELNWLCLVIHLQYPYLNRIETCILEGHLFVATESVTSNTTGVHSVIRTTRTVVLRIFDTRSIWYVLYVLLDEDFNLHLIFFVLVNVSFVVYDKTSRTRSDKRGKYIALCHTQLLVCHTVQVPGIKLNHG